MGSSKGGGGKLSILDAMIPKVKKVMSTPVVKVDAEATVLMLDRGVGSLVVTRSGAPAGIFTRRDLHRRVLAAKRELQDTKIEEVMTKPIITITSDANLKEATDLMEKNRISRLGVLDKGRLVGVLTQTDIRLKYPRGYFSPKLMAKRFIVDTLAYITFWSVLGTLVQVFILRLTWFQFVASSTAGVVLTIVFGGLFGRYLDLFRIKFHV